MRGEKSKECITVIGVTTFPFYLDFDSLPDGIQGFTFSLFLLELFSVKAAFTELFRGGFLNAGALDYKA